MSEAPDAFHCSPEEQLATNVGPAGIDIAYQRTGGRHAPVVLLIMGVASQMIHWPEVFCRELVERGLQVIRFDNRDAGHSTHLSDSPVPNLPAALAGDLSSAAYTLSDMAADAVGLLDALGIERAHVVGASMGGQIAQVMATESPGRVLSLTSMMSTTGGRTVGQTSPEAMRELFPGVPVATREDYVQMYLLVMQVVGSPAYPSDETEVAEVAGRAFDRSYDLAAMTRQAVATVASGDRTEQLRQLSVPALVIHGVADRMCEVSGGRATAAAIASAELVLIDGMGHNLPPGLRSRLAGHIADFVWRVERGRERPQ